MTIREKILEDIKMAMKEKDNFRRDTLRLVNSVIKQVEVDERIEMTDDKVLPILQTQIKRRLDSASQYRAGNREDLASNEEAEIIVLAVATEADITELESYEERQMFLEDIGLDEPGASKLIRAAYHLLNLQTYFTAGVKEVRAWTIHKGDTAPQAAGVIHTDFEKGFIRAEVIAYDDFITYGSEAKVKEAGKMRVEGKEYIVKDGDIMHFRFNV